MVEIQKTRLATTRSQLFLLLNYLTLISFFFSSSTTCACVMTDSPPKRFHLFPLHPSIHPFTSKALPSYPVTDPSRRSPKVQNCISQLFFLFFDYRNQRLLYYTPACCMYVHIQL